MHTNEIFSRHKPSNVHCLLLQYIVAAYILDKAKYINWKFLAGISRKQYFNGLKKVKAVLLLDIAKEIPLLGDTLELGFLRNVIVGSTDSNSFYETVLATSEANLRNSNEYLADIRRPIVSMLTENRAKL